MNRLESAIAEIALLISYHFFIVREMLSTVFICLIIFHLQLGCTINASSSFAIVRE